MSLFQSPIKTTVSNSVLSFFIAQDKDGELNLTPDYQREYEWDEYHAQALMYSVFNNHGIGSVSVVLDMKADKYCEVVDGKQRITTLLGFYNNDFPVFVSKDTGLVVHPDDMNKNGVKLVFFKELKRSDQSAYKHVKLPKIELSSADENKPLSRAEKLAYFYRVNFSGLPISPEHKSKVEQMILEEAKR